MPSCAVSTTQLNNPASLLSLQVLTRVDVSDNEAQRLSLGAQGRNASDGTDDTRGLPAPTERAPRVSVQARRSCSSVLVKGVRDADQSMYLTILK